MQKQLADGLILRTLSEGVASDRERLPQFYAEINGEGDPEWAQAGLAVWTEDLMTGHPTTTLDDIFVIVDPAHDDRIVSATLLIPQTWRYEEVEIPVGRPELVGTHPGYRGRGLVRTLFAAIHERSAALGHQLQTITGIPYFYRQFGYTMALDLDNGAIYPLSVSREMPADYTPTFTLRAATEDDIPDLARWHNYMACDRLVSEVRTPELWRYELSGRQKRSLRYPHYLIIVNAAGEGVGYVQLAANEHRKRHMYCVAYVVGDQASYIATFDDVIIGIKQWAETTFGFVPPMLLFDRGLHPAIYKLVDRKFGGVINTRIYKWYVRVPDPVAFFRLIQPVLERRLEGSGAHRYTGEFKIGFYDLTGIALQFEQGKMVDVKTIRGMDGYSVAFPWHLFWNVVFGDQSADELRAVLPDIEVNGGANAVLLDALFPKRMSWVEGLA
jgi:GNAT superfamily N-acetyltransferase